MRESHDENLCTFSPSLNDEISVVNNLLSVVTLTSLSSENSVCVSPLPTLPLDLVEEILCRLPVKLLCQLRCICKSWNSLITDPKFAKKHFSHSTTRRIHFLSYSTRRICSSFSHTPSHLLTSYPLDSLFTNEVTSDVTQFEFPLDSPRDVGVPHYYFIGSCNGILCIVAHREGFVHLCNPSLRKYKTLPHFHIPLGLGRSYIYPLSLMDTSYGFGYDHVNDNYKVVAVLRSNARYNAEYKVEVKVYTLGTDCWKNIGEFPFDGYPSQSSGKFVSGAIYWLAHKDRKNPCFIVSFDLENESFQEVPKPDYGNVDGDFLILDVLRDCLCLMCGRGHDIWLMKECRNKEFSWTKLFTVSYLRDPSKSYVLYKALHMFEDDQVLIESSGDWNLKLIVYDPKINTFKFTKFQNKSVYGSRWYEGPEVCVESLIFPWS